MHCLCFLSMCRLCHILYIWMWTFPNNESSLHAPRHFGDFFISLSWDAFESSHRHHHIIIVVIHIHTMKTPRVQGIRIEFDRNSFVVPKWDLNYPTVASIRGVSCRPFTCCASRVCLFLVSPKSDFSMHEAHSLSLSLTRFVPITWL